MKCSPLVLLLIFMLTGQQLRAQPSPSLSCAQAAYTARSFRNDPSLRTRSELNEKRLLAWKKALALRPGQLTPLGTTGAPVVLPVVVHIIHNNGAENISDLQVQTAIQHLNEAYANTGYYDPADGAKTDIQFCMAQRDPDNNPTNGITRDVSPYTFMSGPDPTTDDAHVKTIRDWDPLSYINIWVVGSMPDGVAGYATLPYSAGTSADGIVVLAGYFGVNYPGDVVITHEMGHYLGLYHTFEGGCTNNDCSVDGDRVCDTPPDQSTAIIGCGQFMNSCSTDILSGFSTDQNDLTRDYMDYGNLGCMTVFTQGQSDRMNWYIQNVRSSLLKSKACLPPCPSPVSAAFNLPPNPLNAGDTWTFINNSSGTSNFEWRVNGSLISNARDLVYTFPAIGAYSIDLLAKTGDASLCSDAEKGSNFFISCPAGGCVPLPPQKRDTCTVNTFQKRIGGPRQDYGTCVAVDDLGNYLVTGITVSYGAGSADMQVIKLDPAGNLTWARAYGNALINNGGDGVFTKDGGSIHAGFSILQENGNTKALIVLNKLDDSGNLQWSKNYENAGFTMEGARIIQTTDGNYLLNAFGDVDFPYSVPAILMKIDSYGNIIWCKQYFSNYYITPNCMAEDGDQYIIEESLLTNYPNPNYSSDILVYSVDKATGNLRWSKDYTVNHSTQAYGFQVLPDGDRLFLNLLYITGETSATTGVHEGFITLDKQGVFRNAYTLDHLFPTSSGVGSQGFRTYIAGTKDGNLCFSYGNAPVDSSDIRLAIMTPEGKLITAKRYVLPDPQLVERIENTPDSGFVTVGTTEPPNGNYDVYLLKTDSKLRLTDPSHQTAGCQVIDEHPPISQPLMTTTDFPTIPLDVNIIVSDNQPTVTPFQPEISDFCANAALCDSLKIAGSDTVCVSNTDTLVFTSGKGIACGLPVQWKIDPSFATILSSTDSCIRLRFKIAGVTTLYATMLLDCKIILDSMTIHAFRSPDTIDLGADIALCHQSTIRLDAGSGFRSYLWQNGTIDSTYTAYYPGIYYVNAQDYCGRSYGDTITITEAPDLSFDLGPDLVICRTDTLSITAPPGFSGYYWTPDYQMADRYAQTVKVAPLQDTAYTCTAQKGRGCTVIDTIRVHVEDLPKDFLSHQGPIPGICVGDLVELSAVGNWKAYQWSDLTTGPTITVGSAGTYWLKVTDDNNCTAKDSVTIIPGSCKPGVYFPNAFAPGQGSNAIFRPLVSVALDKFYMAIYSRSGEKVFETKDPVRGWNGEFQGHAMTSNAFIWYATYHVQGSLDKEQLVKGTLMLIR
jgi:hypothetical protein